MTTLIKKIPNLIIILLILAACFLWQEKVIIDNQFYGSLLILLAVLTIKNDCIEKIQEIRDKNAKEESFLSRKKSVKKEIKEKENSIEIINLGIQKSLKIMSLIDEISLLEEEAGLKNISEEFQAATTPFLEQARDILIEKNPLPEPQEVVKPESDTPDVRIYGGNDDDSGWTNHYHFKNKR